LGPRPFSYRRRVSSIGPSTCPWPCRSASSLPPLLLLLLWLPPLALARRQLGVHPLHRTTPLVNFSRRDRMCRVTSGCEGGAGEKKPHQGVQTAVLSAGGHRREASCSDLCREHNLSECVLLRWRKEYEARGEAAFTEKSRSLAKRSPREARRSPSWSVSAGSSPWRIRS
jgi:hypothetical protein